MRVIYFVFLLAFIATVGIFAYFNQQAVTVRFLDWSAPANVALVAFAAYVLGMLSGWTVVGMLRRSWDRVIEPTRADYHRQA
jgi:lipopolysaccharide assembly protein A